MRNQNYIKIFEQNVTISRLQKDANRIDFSEDKIDKISYPEFLKYFDKLNKITRHNVVIGIGFTYSWMPMMFRFKSDNIDEVVIILNKAKSGIIQTLDELFKIKKCLNNSTVGMSKILHFIKPDCFPIIDSRVFSYLMKSKNNNNNEDLYDPAFYLDYLSFCNEIIVKKEYLKIHKKINDKFDIPLSKMRTLELIMYKNA